MHKRESGREGQGKKGLEDEPHLAMFSSSLLVIFFSTASTMPSSARIPTQIPAWEMASMAYSTW
jgi:hypothetical protein